MTKITINNTSKKKIETINNILKLNYLTIKFVNISIKFIKLMVLILSLQFILSSCTQSIRFTSTKINSNENITSAENKKSDKESRLGKSKRASDNVKKNTDKLDLSNNPTIANDNSYGENHFNPYKPIPKKSSKINAETESEINEQGELIVHASSKWLGTPYRYGGNSEEGIDCSALTQNSYSDVGIMIPRTSTEQYEYCDLIEPDERKVGDLVFFANNTTISHVGIYAGGNEVIHASTSQGVIKQSIYSPFLFNNFVSFGRVNKSMSMR